MKGNREQGTGNREFGWVRLAEPLPVTAIHNCVISRQADRWFIAIKYEVEKPPVA